jgi:hypothetical protein
MRLGFPGPSDEPGALDAGRAIAAFDTRSWVQGVDAGHFACVREDFGPRILRRARCIERALDPVRPG